MNFLSLLIALAGPHLKQIFHVKPTALKGAPGVKDDAHAAQLADAVNALIGAQIDAQVAAHAPANITLPVINPEHLVVPVGPK